MAQEVRSHRSVNSVRKGFSVGVLLEVKSLGKGGVTSLAAYA